MSERAGVLNINITAVAKIQDLEETSGAKLKIMDGPSFRTNLVIIGQTGHGTSLTKEQTDKLSAVLEYVVAQLFARSMKIPDGIERVEEFDSNKDAVN